MLAKERGLWNLFLPAESGLTNLEYAPLAELTGWSLEIAPEVTNCAAPDTGNMETLHLFATEEQRKQWLEPLLDGEIRSGVLDDRARGGLQRRPQHRDARSLRDGGDYVINGRKWWTSGRVRPALQDPDRDGPHQPRRGQPSAAVDGAGAHRHTRGDRRALDAGVRLAGPARALRDRLRQRAGAGRRTCSARRARASRSPRRGSARAASTTACARSGAAERALALMVDRVQQAGRVRQAAGRAGRGAASRSPSPATRSTRPGCCARRRRGPSTSTATRRPTCWCPRSRRWRRRWHATSSTARSRCTARPACQRRLPAGPALRLAPRHAAVRRSRRGAHAHHRARGDRPREERFRRGGDELVAVGVGELSGAWNFRDVAEETGVRPGRLLPVQRAEPTRRRRARELIRRLGITDVADLRSPREVERRGPGQVPDGVDGASVAVPRRVAPSTVRRRTRPRSRR